MDDTNVEHRNFLFIIESPGAEDFLEDRKEGDTLRAMLELAGIQAKYRTVVTKAAFVASLVELSKFSLSASHYSPEDVQISGGRYRSRDAPLKRTLFHPVLHLSCHSNEELLAFSSGEKMTWHEFGGLLYELNDEIGWINDDMSHLAIGLSSCDGYAAAKRVIHDGKPAPFVILIGPTEPVSWADSLVAFSVYYHLTLTDRLPGGIGEGVKRMNMAAGLEPNTFRGMNWQRKETDDLQVPNPDMSGDDRRER